MKRPSKFSAFPQTEVSLKLPSSQRRLLWIAMNPDLCSFANFGQLGFCFSWLTASDTCRSKGEKWWNVKTHKYKQEQMPPGRSQRLSVFPAKNSVSLSTFMMDFLSKLPPFQWCNTSFMAVLITSCSHPPMPGATGIFTLVIFYLQKGINKTAVV